jgi:hypothetical protein
VAARDERAVDPSRFGFEKMQRFYQEASGVGLHQKLYVNENLGMPSHHVK